MKFSVPMSLGLAAMAVAEANPEPQPAVDLNQIFQDLQNAGVVDQVQQAYSDNKAVINQALGQVDTAKVWSMLQDTGLSDTVLKFATSQGGLSTIMNMLGGGNNDKREGSANPIADMMIQGMLGSMFNQPAKREAESGELVDNLIDSLFGNLGKRDDTGAAGGSATETLTTVAGSSLAPAAAAAESTTGGNFFDELFGVASLAAPASSSKIPDDLFSSLYGPSPTGSANLTGSSGGLLDDLFGDLFGLSDSTEALNLTKSALAALLLLLSGLDNFFGDLLDLIFGSLDSSTKLATTTTTPLLTSLLGSLIDEIVGLVGDVLESLFSHAGDWIEELLQDLFGGSLSGLLSSGDISFGSLIGGIFELIFDSLFGGSLSGLQTSLKNGNSVFTLSSSGKKCCCLPQFKAKRMQQKRMLKRVVQAKVEHNLMKRLHLMAKRDVLQKRMFEDRLFKRLAEI